MNILLTSAGRRSYIVDYFKRCEGIDEVFTSNSEYSIALQHSDGYFISPLIYSADYIPSLIKFCKEHDVKALLSLFDIDLLVLSKYEKEFADNGINLILAPFQFVKICNDKWETYQFLRYNGIPTPKTYKNLAKLKNDLSDGSIQFPIIMKPRWGMASMGIYRVESVSELDVFTEKCKRDIFNSYLKYESSQTEEEAIIYQEIINGAEYGLDVLNDLNGNYIKTFAKQKVTMRSGETDLGRTANALPFEQISSKIADLSGHHGILSVDCFLTERGIYVIEMNCRISGHYPLAYLAGFNYPQLLLDWLNGKPTNEKLLEFKENLYIVKDLVPTILQK